MNIIPEIAALEADMRGWRHHLHAHPETAFEETATTAFVADKLRSFGLEVHTGLAGTGVVGVLRNGRHRPRGRHCAPTSTRCTSTSSPASPHALADTRARCTRAATTATRRCCSARRSALAQRRNFDGTVVFHLPAGRGERRRRPRHGRARAVRAIPDAARCTACTTGRSCRSGKFALRAGTADGRVRHLRDRRDRPAARTRRCRTSAATRCRSPRT